MKIFPTNRRKDTVEKRPLTITEVRFLQDLQKEMNEQDTFCQADPRFWVIRGTERVYGTEDGYPCICRPGSDPLTSWEEFRDLIDQTVKKLYGVEGCKAKLCPGNYIEVYIDGEETDSLFDADEVAEWLNEHDVEARPSTFEDVSKIYSSTLFLTYRDACEHLKANYYHYSDDAHPYAMTAWRDPTCEKLWKILQETDWEGCMNGWDLCKEMPPDKSTVLVSVLDNLTGEYCVQMAAWFEDEGWILDHSDEGDYIVLGWMPMPKPLEIEEEI